MHLEYLWGSCIAPVATRSDLYRLTFAIEQLKSQGWINAVVSDDDWGQEALAEEYGDSEKVGIDSRRLSLRWSGIWWRAWRFFRPIPFRQS